MNNRLRLPGFPLPEHQDIVRFHVLKKLNYTNRIMLYLLLLFSGFINQIFTLKVWPGALFLIFATIITMVRGYDSRIRLKSFALNSRWVQVEMDQIRRIEELHKKITRWDTDILDISNFAGFLMFILTFAGMLFVSWVANSGFSLRQTGIIFTADTIILLLPLWFNGIRRILKQGNLQIKIDIIKQMEAYFQAVKKDGENFSPSLLLAKGREGKSVPTDCRFHIAFDGMPSDFYGIMAQINLNIVQGTSYPYFYCVIAAKPGFGLSPHAIRMFKPKGITIEYDEDNNAEVIVIRQYTTQTSGYHTKINDCRKILDKALFEARTILSEQKDNNSAPDA